MRHHVHTAVVAAVVAGLVTFLLPRPAGLPSQPPTASSPTKETAYDRVMRTGVLRCGYLVWPPTLSRDVNTGKLSGIMVDYMEEMARRLQLKVEWAHEMNLTTFLQDLNNGKFDVECSGGWPNALRGKQATYTKPMFYFPLYAAVRADDHRFDNNYSAINNPEVRVVTWEGETSAMIRSLRFPQSQAVVVPSTLSPAEIMLNVVTGKADVTIQDYAALANFEKNNPGQLRQVAGPPLRVIPYDLTVPLGDFKLQQMLNVAADELAFDGVVNDILDKYETIPGTYLRIAPPYEVK